MSLNALIAAIPETPRIQSAYEQDIVEETFREHSQLALMRYNFEAQWEETASLIMPSMRNTFRYLSFLWPGMKKTEMQVDTTGMLALSRFGAIVESLCTPANMIWHTLSSLDPSLNKDRACRLWFLEATRTMFRYRYQAASGFIGQIPASWVNLGAFGNHYMFVDRLSGPHGPEKGLRYKSLPVGEVYLRENHQGVPIGFIRWFKLTAVQALEMFGPEAFPPVLKPALMQNSQILYDFFHRVCPRTDYDPERLDHRAMPWASYYVCVASRTLVREGGYRTFPMAVGRYLQFPGETYGRGPAQLALPALKTLNAEKSDFLKIGHRTADPVLFTGDDGLADAVNLTPGAVNPGGVNSDGKLIVQPLPIGNIQITKEMMEEERNIINDLFLVSLFQMLEERSNMSATEVIERVNEKGILLAPTLGRQAEFLGPLIDRELDELMYQRLLPPMPPKLREAIAAGQGEYHPIYTSPLAKAARAQEAAGFMRTLETMQAAAQATGDASLLDFIAFDRAGPGLADIQSVPEDWLASQAEIAAKQRGRLKAQQTEQQIKAAPAQAAMMKAQAVAAKAAPQGGGGIPAPVLGQMMGLR